MSMIDQEEPAAVLLDIMMPDIQTGLEAGASLYLTKPVVYLDQKYALEKVHGA